MRLMQHKHHSQHSSLKLPFLQSCSASMRLHTGMPMCKLLMGV